MQKEAPSLEGEVQLASAPEPPESIESSSLIIQDSAIELLKWIAIIAMTIDHIGTFILDQEYPVLNYIGRIAFPMFAIIMAYNLARPRSSEAESKAIIGAIKRLLLFGLIASVPYHLLTNEELPLNIMFTLALAAVVILTIKTGAENSSRAYRYTLYFSAHAVFLLCSIFVEYSFHGVALIVSAWLFFRYSSVLGLLGIIAITLGLATLNNNYYAMLALPLLASSYFIEVKIPRTPKYFFYAYYPAHLTVIYLAILLNQSSVFS